MSSSSSRAVTTALLLVLLRPPKIVFITDDVFYYIKYEQYVFYIPSIVTLVNEFLPEEAEIPVEEETDDVDDLDDDDLAEDCPSMLSSS